LVEERDVGRNIEKYYRATATSFSLELDAEQLDNPGAAVLNFLKNDLSNAIAKLDPAKKEAIFGLIKSKKIAAKNFGVFSEKLANLFEEYSDCSEDENGQQYALNISLYPHEVDYGPLESYTIWKDGPMKEKLEKKIKK